MDVLPLSPLDIVVYGLVLLAALFVAKRLLSSPSPAPTASKPARLDIAKPTPHKVFSPEEVAKHNTRDDCWLIIEGRVYDVSQYVPDHVGGDAILKNAGADSTTGFLGPQVCVLCSSHSFSFK